MRTILKDLIQLLKEAGFAKGISPTGRNKNKYTITVITTLDDQQIRGTIAGATLNVRREIIVILRYPGTNNPDKEIEQLGKQDEIIASFYNYAEGNIIFTNAEMTEISEEILNEIRFTYFDKITL